jgi:hypothetical protein
MITLAALSLRHCPLGERCLRAAGHRQDYRAKADGQDRPGPETRESHDPVPSTRRIREDRSRLHDGSVPTSGFLSW